MGLMAGFPPSLSNQVTLTNWRKAPFNRWAYSHVRELVPSASIRCDRSRSAPLVSTPADLTRFEVVFDGRSLGLKEWFSETFTDSLVVLRNGNIVFEDYVLGQDAETQHIWMSVSKSILGLVAGIVIDRGELNVSSQLRDLLPEIAGTAFAEATVRDALDMRIGIRFDEDYQATRGPIIQYRKAHLWDPVSAGEAPSDLRSFLASMRERDGEHTGRFHYVSPNTDLLGWVLERATGQRYSDLIAETLWQPMGAEQEAYITVDRLGAFRCAGGVCAVPRDLARLARLFVTGGRRGDAQVVPERWINDIIHGGDVTAWCNGDFYELFDRANMHYRSKWYVLRGTRPLVFGLGVFGQNVFVDVASDLVVAKASSQPLPLDKAMVALTLQGIEQLRKLLC